MILSRGRRYLFIHIPKTGGTSMALALEARTMKDDLMLGDTIITGGEDKMYTPLISPDAPVTERAIPSPTACSDAHE